MVLGIGESEGEKWYRRKREQRMEGNHEKLAKLQADDWDKLTRAALGYGYRGMSDEA